MYQVQKKSEFMSWSMLKEVSNSNGLILNHSKSHESLVGMDIQTLKKEIEQNQIEIEKNLANNQKFSRIHTEKVAKA